MKDLNQIKNEIRGKISMLELVGAHTRLARAGRNYMGLCPFHNEKTPSFSVNAEEAWYYCFGCGKKGDLFSFVMETERCEFMEALRILAEKAGVSLEEGLVLKTDTDKAAVLELNRRVSGSFHHILLNQAEAAEARTYLEKRKIERSTLDAFTIGFAPAQGEWLHAFLAKRNYSDRILAKSGLFSARHPRWSMFSARIMFPIMNRKSETVGFGGRILSGDGPKYLNSPETEYFRKSENLYGISQAVEGMRREKTAILVEGYVDVLAAHQAGIKGVVAPLGTAFTAAQAALLKRLADRVILFFDSDPAGMAAARKAALICEQIDLACLAVKAPPGMDPAEVLEKEGPEALHKILKSPINIFEFLLKQTLEHRDWKTPEGKKLAAEELFPYINSMTSLVKREASLEMLADALGRENRAVGDDFNRFLSARRKDDRSEVQPKTNRISNDLYLMLATAVHSEYFANVRSMIGLEDLEDPAARDLFILLEDGFRQEDAGIQSILSQTDDEELKELVLKKAVSDEFSVNTGQLIRDAVWQVRARSLENKRRLVSEKLKRSNYDQTDDALAMRDLLEQKMYLDAELEKMRTRAND
jgi:DNA primase